MIERTTLSTNTLLDALRELCGLPTAAGHREDLAQAAPRIAGLLREFGLKTEVLSTSGAPIIVAQRAGRSPATVLLYHHYDVAAAGPWRAWHHDPFQLAERDDTLYGRGVAQGKGPLAAHLAALHALLQAGELPCGVVLVIEGEGLRGSPNLPPVVRELEGRVRVDACLASGGERSADAAPICYGGAKGMVQARLTVVGANQPLLAGYGVSAPNPLWRLIWALGQIKSTQEEVLINGFYDAVDGPNRNDSKRMRAVQLDEAGRLSAWGLNAFLFDASGLALVRTEATLPTCNVSSVSVEPDSEQALIPVTASAQLDFQLVPHQSPHTIIDLLRDHLAAKEFGDVDVERIAGGYAALAMPLDAPFVQQVANTGEAVFGAPLPLLPLGPFAAPLHIFAEAFHAPAAAIGFSRPDNAANGPNEHVLLQDVLHHGELLVELLASFGMHADQDAGHESAVGEA